MNLTSVHYRRIHALQTLMRAKEILRIHAGYKAIVEQQQEIIIVCRRQLRMLKRKGILHGYRQTKENDYS